LRKEINLPPVHGLWIGEELSRLEILSMRSFLYWGHKFNLWMYNPPRTHLPEGVILRDASEILPSEMIFQRQFKAPGLKIGLGSFALFSDLFRLKLLSVHGGWWVDMDITCLRPLLFSEDYVFRPHDQLPIMGNIMKCPAGCPVMRHSYQEAARETNKNTLDWLAVQRILARNVQNSGLLKFRKEICNHDLWEEILPYIQEDPPTREEWHAFHWCNEQWRVKGLDKNNPIAGSFLDKLMRLYDV
jgi:Glycosyltransferase sugar-binding region containing DXD motif